MLPKWGCFQDFPFSGAGKGLTNSSNAQAISRLGRFFVRSECNKNDAETCTISPILTSQCLRAVRQNGAVPHARAARTALLEDGWLSCGALRVRCLQLLVYYSAAPPASALRLLPHRGSFVKLMMVRSFSAATALVASYGLLNYGALMLFARRLSRGH